MKFIILVDSETGESEKLGVVETIDPKLIEEVRLSELINLVCQITSVSKNLLLSKYKHDPYSQIRFILFYIIKENYKIDNNSAIGRMFNKSPATILHGLNIVKESVFGIYKEQIFVSYYTLIMEILKKNKMWYKTLIIDSLS